jgi:hypothetical protein
LLVLQEQRQQLAVVLVVDPDLQELKVPADQVVLADQVAQLDLEAQRLAEIIIFQGGTLNGYNSKRLFRFCRLYRCSGSSRN